MSACLFHYALHTLRPAVRELLVSERADLPVPDPDSSAVS